MCTPSPDFTSRSVSAPFCLHAATCNQLHGSFSAAIGTTRPPPPLAPRQVSKSQQAQQEKPASCSATGAQLMHVNWKHQLYNPPPASSLNRRSIAVSRIVKVNRRCCRAAKCRACPRPFALGRYLQRLPARGGHKAAQQQAHQAVGAPAGASRHNSSSRLAPLTPVPARGSSSCL